MWSVQADLPGTSGASRARDRRRDERLRRDALGARLPRARLLAAQPMTALDAFTELVRTPAPQFPLLECAAELPLYSDRRCDPPRVVATVRGWGSTTARARRRRHVRTESPADAQPLLLRRARVPPQHRQLLQPGQQLPASSRRAAHRHSDLAGSALHRDRAGRSGSSCRASGSPGISWSRRSAATECCSSTCSRAGCSLSAAELRRRLTRCCARRPAGAPLEAYLRVASEREILARMLHNLKAIHADARTVGQHCSRCRAAWSPCCPTVRKSAATAGSSTRSSGVRARRPATWPRISR